MNKINQNRINWLREQIRMYENAKRTAPRPEFMDNAISIYKKELQKEGVDLNDTRQRSK